MILYLFCLIFCIPKQCVFICCGSKEKMFYDLFRQKATSEGKNIAVMLHYRLNFYFNQNRNKEAFKVIIFGKNSLFIGIHYFSDDGVIKLILKRRKGFVKLALRYGVDIVPTFSFGESFIYGQVKGRYLPYLLLRESFNYGQVKGRYLSGSPSFMAR